MNLETVKRMGPPRPSRKRVGRGKGSGLGKTSTRGQKGQGAHSSGGRHKIGFEGGQMPLYRRLGKRGFSNFRFRKVFTIINLDLLDAFEDGASIDFEAIKAKGLVSPEGSMLKVLGDGELKKKFNVSAHRLSESAKRKIQAAGGTFQELEPRPEVKRRPPTVPNTAPKAPSSKTETKQAKNEAKEAPKD